MNVNLTSKQKTKMNCFKIIKNTRNCRKLVFNRFVSTNNTQDTVLVDQVGNVRTIGINRPEKRNCLDTDTILALEKAVGDFENDNNSLSGVLYGIGGNFCSGYDLQEIAADNEPRDLLKRSLKCTMRTIKKPLVAGVSGYAVAGGLELALMCDLRVVEDTAKMAMLNRRFGVPLIDGGTVRLQAMIGLSRAVDLVLTGRTISAKEAFEWGLANRIVACGTSLGQAINLATSLVKFPQDCLLNDRKSVYNAAYSLSYEKLLQFERENAQHSLTAGSIEGANKFLSGIGRHGKSYDLTEKPRKHWEVE